jgi:hypothetical protein
MARIGMIQQDAEAQIVEEDRTIEKVANKKQDALSDSESME